MVVKKTFLIFPNPLKAFLSSGSPPRQSFIHSLSKLIQQIFSVGMPSEGQPDTGDVTLEMRQAGNEERDDSTGGDKLGKIQGVLRRAPPPHLGIRGGFLEEVAQQHCGGRKACDGLCQTQDRTGPGS